MSATTKEYKIPICISLPVKWLQALDNLAGNQKKERTELVNEAVQLLFEKYKVKVET